MIQHPPISPAQMSALFNSIASELGQPENGRCDHTHRHSEAFAKSNNVDWPQLKQWLRSTGGYCDCEVLLNSASCVSIGV